HTRCGGDQLTNCGTEAEDIPIMLSFRKPIVSLVFTLAMGLRIASPCAADTIPDLGAAADFAVLGLNNSAFTITGSGSVTGDIAIAQGGEASVAGNVTGSAIQSSSGQITGSGTITGGISVNPSLMSAANSGALSAYNTAVADTATQTFGAINTST